MAEGEDHEIMDFFILKLGLKDPKKLVDLMILYQNILS